MMIKTFRWNLINAPCLPGRAGRRFLITFLWVWVQSFLRALLSGPVSKMDYLISHKSSNEYNEFYSAYVDTQHWDVSKGWETCLQHRVKMVRLFVQSWLALDEMSQTPAPLPCHYGRPVMTCARVYNPPSPGVSPLAPVCLGLGV